jgi:hypothetical protein
MKAQHRFAPRLEPVERRTLLNAPRHRPAPIVAVSPADVPPVIATTNEVVHVGKVVAFTIAFSKDVIPGPLSSLSHYALYDEGLHNPYHGSPVPLASAIYDPTQTTLTLIPVSPAPIAPYVLTSPNPNDRSTGFITDTQGRPLMTSTHDFTVFFGPGGASLLNAVLTASPQVNQMTGAHFALSALASYRSEERFLANQNGFQIAHGVLAGVDVLLRSL